MVIMSVNEKKIKKKIIIGEISLDLSQGSKIRKVHFMTTNETLLPYDKKIDKSKNYSKRSEIVYKLLKNVNLREKQALKEQKICELIGKTVNDYIYNEEIEYLILLNLLNTYKRSNTTSLNKFTELKLHYFKTTLKNKLNIIEIFNKFRPVINNILLIRNNN